MGNSIADFLSSQDKHKLLMPNVNKGDIFRMNLTPKEGVIPKHKEDVDRDKYFIVIGKTDNNSLIGFVLINTSINNGLEQKLKDLHYPISGSKYPFLGKNRFVCCSELKEITEKNFIERYDTNGRFGTLDNEDMQLVIGALKESPLVTPKQLKRYGL